MAQDHHVTIEPKRYQLSPQATKGLLGLMILGVIGIAASYAIGGQVRGSVSLLMGSYFFLCLAIAGAFFCGFNHLSNAGWSVTMRRVPEAFMSLLPVGSLLVIGAAILGHHHLYEWTHLDVVAQDILLTEKSAYLNVKSFFIRLVVTMGLMGFFAWKMLSTSLRQDKERTIALTKKNAFNAAVFLLVFALSFAFINYDLLMSLEPHWFSTMYSVYCFAGMFYAGLAMMGIFTVGLMRRGYFGSYVNVEHVHDVAKFMFAFVVFWAYIAFGQYMLIWYANIPEETTYYLRRWHEAWKYLSLALIVIKFVIPFALLLPQRMKRTPWVVEKVGIWMLFAQFVELCWLILPSLYSVYKPENQPHHHYSVPLVPELLAVVGFVGLFVYLALRFLSKHNIVPVGDPRLHESIHHHNV